MTTATKKAIHKKKMRRRLALGIIIILAAAYLAVSIFFTRHFLPHTTLNDVPIGGKTAASVEQMLYDQIADYTLTIEERNANPEIIRGADIDLTEDFGDRVSEFLKNQGAFIWITKLQGTKAVRINNIAKYDERKLSSALSRLACTDEDLMIDSVDASISKKQVSGEFIIVKESYGTRLNDRFNTVIRDMVDSMSTQVSLADEGCYIEPVYTEESPEVIEACKRINELTSKKISYDMGDDCKPEVISPNRMRKMLRITKDWKVGVNQSQVALYVDKLAEKYNTSYTARRFTTTGGEEITLYDGPYGWRLNQKKEEEQLEKDLMGDKDVSREPMWLYTATTHRVPNFGNTYVEVNLSAQTVYVYKDGERILTTDCVTGNTSKKHGTHTGMYPILYKEHNATLVGEDYESPVTYWMPFNGNEGLHDAPWRSSFGGSIYKTSGSHGCVNLPPYAARIIFENIPKNTAVIVYGE